MYQSCRSPHLGGAGGVRKLFGHPVVGAWQGTDLPVHSHLESEPWLCSFGQEDDQAGHQLLHLEKEIIHDDKRIELAGFLIPCSRDDISDCTAFPQGR